MSDSIPSCFSDLAPLPLTPEWISNGGIVLLFIGVVLMFWSFSFVCEEYCVPAIALFCKRNNISEDVTGAIFIGAGLSSPSLFVCFVGIFASNSAIAVGSVIGGNLFNNLPNLAAAIYASTETCLPLDKGVVARESIIYFLSLLLLVATIKGDVTRAINRSWAESEWLSCLNVTWVASLILVLCYGVYVLVAMYYRPLADWITLQFSKQSPRSKQVLDCYNLVEGGEEGGAVAAGDIETSSKHSSGQKSREGSVSSSSSHPRPHNFEPSPPTVVAIVLDSIPSRLPTDTVNTHTSRQMPQQEQQGELQGVNKDWEHFSQNDQQQDNESPQALAGSEDLSEDSSIKLHLKQSPYLHSASSVHLSIGGKDEAATTPVSCKSSHSSSSQKRGQSPNKSSSTRIPLSVEASNLDSVSSVSNSSEQENHLDLEANADGVLATLVSLEMDTPEEDDAFHFSMFKKNEFYARNGSCFISTSRMWHLRHFVFDKHGLYYRADVLDNPRGPYCRYVNLFELVSYRIATPATEHSGAELVLELKGRRSICFKFRANDLQTTVKVLERLEAFKEGIHGISVVERQKRAMIASLTVSGDGHKATVPEDDTSYNNMFIVPRGAVGAVVYYITLPVKLIVYYTTPDVRRPGNEDRVILSIIISFSWIALQSYVLIDCLTLIGNMFQISSVALGLTVASWASSYPALWSSVVVARDGLGDCAFCNAMGSSIFNNFIGLSLPWLLFIASKNGEPYNILLDDGFTFSLIVLFAVLVVSVIIIGFGNWALQKWMAPVFMFLYFATTFGLVYLLAFRIETRATCGCAK